MTETDRTGEKLAASIRKTKAETATATTDDKPAESTPDERATSRRKPASSRDGSGSTRVTKKTPKKPSSEDGFQVGRRVWPD
jgi:hypothetical protein